MADESASPILKRKREEGGSQRKKAKKQRTSKTADEVDVEESELNDEIATSSTNTGPKEPSGSTPHDETGIAQVTQTKETIDTATTTPSNSRKDKKNKKRKQSAKVAHTAQTQKKEEDIERDQTVVAEEGVASKAEDPKITDGPIEGVLKGARSKKQKSKKTAAWLVSDPLGGWFLPHDPVFSTDEKFLILANARALQIYSTETSLLTSQLPVGNSAALVAYALSPVKASLVYVADSNGLIILWDWVDKRKVGRWDIGAKIRQLAVATQPESSQDLVYCHEIGESHIINVHALRAGNQASKTELKRILKTNSIIKEIRVFLQGKIVVATCANSVMIGKRSKITKTALQDFEYVWRELKTPKRITASSVYIRTPEPTDAGKRPAQDQKDHVDLAIGDEAGVISLFEDILSSFAAVEKNKKDHKNKPLDIDNFRPKRLHWHREAVGSLEWSLDGNYLLSGGGETVLVIWQLSTGKQQHLPHLTAAIENIVVSPGGASYALSLANNSIVVLSTSELHAKAHIIGTQSRRVDLERLPRESNSTKYSFDIFTGVPLIVDPKNSNQVIFSIPSSQPRHQNLGVPPEPYIQTFDFATNRPISRQALTRNNATDPNMGPEGRRIQEPNVKLIQISNDGKWLATVDEWAPPREDMGYHDEGIAEFNEEERSFRRESYLKFWQWDEKNAQWSLMTRIDAPHYFEDVGACSQVLDLVFNPHSPGFATIGEDRVVRIWRPKTRLRGGITVRGAGKSNEGLVTWSLDQSVEISSQLNVLDSSTPPRNSLAPRNARLAFSVDGSVLAAGVSWASESDSGVIHIIDPEYGTVRRSITELDISVLSGLAVVGRYLVVVGNSIKVWDLVLDQLAYSVPVETPGISVLDRIPLVRLAVNDLDETFAVSYPQFEQNTTSKSRGTRYFKKATSKVFILDPSQPTPLWSTKIPAIVLAIASLKGGKGYVTLDSTSSIRLISPKARILQLPTPPPVPAMERFTGDMELQQGDEDSRGKTKPVELVTDEVLLRNSENDKPVVRPEQLQEIFDVGPSYALPTVKDLFNAVVGLYARKPRSSSITGKAQGYHRME